MSRECKEGIYIIFFIITVLCFFSAGPADAERLRQGDPRYTFYKGNSFYEEGRYDSAIDQYSKLLSQGLESGNLYYNIGNCYFKKGEPGKAVLYYEKAKRLIPRDSDLESNYEFVLSKLDHPKIENSVSWLQKITGFFDGLTVNELSVLLSAVFVCGVVVLVLRMFSHTLRRYSKLTIAALGIMFILISVSLYGKASVQGTEAVILAETSEARFEPIKGSTVHFTLHEGMKIKIIEVNKDWTRIRRSDGKAGWIRTEDMEKI